MGIRTDRGRRLIDKCGRGGVFFKAAVQPAGAVGSVTVDDEMPKLAGAVVMTMIYFTTKKRQEIRFRDGKTLMKVFSPEKLIISHQ